MPRQFKLDDALGETPLTYTSNTIGTDTVVARFVDDSGDTQNSNPATVEWIVPPNVAPIASDTNESVNEDMALNASLTASDADGDPLIYTIMTGPNSGTLTAFDSNTGSFTYQPNANYNGPDSFTFKVNDGTVDSNIATVSINVIPVNDAPTVATNTAAVSVDEAQTATNSGTVGDVDGDIVTLSASVGTVTNNNDGTWSWSFASSDGPSESQTVTISANDGNGGTAQTSFALTVNNVAPTVNAGADQTVYRNDVVTMNGTWTDPAGAADNAYAWTWDLNGDTLADTSGSASYGDSVPGTTSFVTEGIYTLNFNVTDKDSATGSDTLTVTVLNQPPSCDAVAPSVAELWTANHQMVPVTINGVTDPEGDAVTITVTGIMQDEPTNGLGDGDTSPDGAGVGTSTAELRAERAGGGNGRFYHISFTADDGHGGSCTGTVQVSVPKSQGKNGAAVDDGPLFDSTGGGASAASRMQMEPVMLEWLYLPVVAGQ